MIFSNTHIRNKFYYCTELWFRTNILEHNTLPFIKHNFANPNQLLLLPLICQLIIAKIQSTLNFGPKKHKEFGPHIRRNEFYRKNLIINICFNNRMFTTWKGKLQFYLSL